MWTWINFNFWQMHKLLQPTVPLWMPNFPLDSFIFLWIHPLPLLPRWIPAFSQPQSHHSFYFSVLNVALVLLKARQQIFIGCPFLFFFVRSKYKSAPDPPGFVLLLDKREGLGRKVLQGTSRHWHFHGKEDTSSGFAETLVSTEHQRDWKKKI